MRARARHIVNISGGKDSQAVYELAVLRGEPFRAIMADTGMEHEWTLEHASRLHEASGGPPVEFIKADFTEQLRAKQEYVRTKWPQKGHSDERIRAALAALEPTGIPFLDACLWKGVFPSTMGQWCTDLLKVDVAWRQVIGPLLAAQPVVQWIGVRRDESPNRKASPFFQRVRMLDDEGDLLPHTLLYVRPLVHWTAQNVFSFLRHLGRDVNPLYKNGMRRVGCFPCIHVNKDDIAVTDSRFPLVKERLAAWEKLVGDASSRGAATFFAPSTTPRGIELGRAIHARAHAEIRAEHPGEHIPTGRTSTLDKRVKRRVSELGRSADWPKAPEVFAWSHTGRGGRQMQMFDLLEPDDGVSCSSQYGLCE